MLPLATCGRQPDLIFHQELSGKVDSLDHCRQADGNTKDSHWTSRDGSNDKASHQGVRSIEIFRWRARRPTEDGCGG